MDSMGIGANAKAMLKGYVDRLFEIAEEKRGINEDIKEKKKELKEQNLPVTQLIREAKRQRKDEGERRMEEADTRLARQLLGLPVFVEDSSPAPIDPQQAQIAQQGVEAILRLEEERKALTEDEKEIKQEAKGAGFSPTILTKVVAFMVDPDKRTKFNEDSTLLDMYWDAVNG